MEISNSARAINSSLTSASEADNSRANTSTNFGIGQPRQNEVELSPQARVLQQTEQNQRNAQQSVQEARAELDPPTNEFIRITSSIGRSSQSNRLTSEQALDMYRSIEKLI